MVLHENHGQWCRSAFNNWRLYWIFKIPQCHELYDRTQTKKNKREDELLSQHPIYVSRNKRGTPQHNQIKQWTTWTRRQYDNNCRATRPIKTRAPSRNCFHSILCTYDYNMLIEGLLPTNVCLVAVLSSEQCPRFERFRLWHVQMVTKRPVSNQNWSAIGRGDGNSSPFEVYLSQVPDRRLPVTYYSSANSWRRSCHLPTDQTRHKS